jgi:predicted nucleotidyltransferase
MHRLRVVLSRHPEVRLALLFGSRARGQHAAGADLDLAIEGEAVDRLELGRELGAATGLDIDLVPIEHAGYPLLNAILRDGILVHEGALHARAQFLTGAFLHTETDRPWFERMRDAYLDRLALQADG